MALGATRGVAVAATPPPPQPRDRQQRRDLAGDPGGVEQGIVDAGEAGLATAGLAVGEMASQLTAFAQAELQQRLRLAGSDQDMDVLAAPAADELVVLLAEPAAASDRVLSTTGRDMPSRSPIWV